MKMIFGRSRVGARSGRQKVGPRPHDDANRHHVHGGGENAGKDAGDIFGVDELRLHVRDAERENLILQWDLGIPEEPPAAPAAPAV